MNNGQSKYRQPWRQDTERRQAKPINKNNTTQTIKTMYNKYFTKDKQSVKSPSLISPLRYLNRSNTIDITVCVYKHWYFVSRVH